VFPDLILIKIEQETSKLGVIDLVHINAIFRRVYLCSYKVSDADTRPRMKHIPRVSCGFLFQKDEEMNDQDYETNQIFFIKIVERKRNNMRGLHTHSRHSTGDFMSLALIDEIFGMGEIKVLSYGTFVLFACSNLDI